MSKIKENLGVGALLAAVATLYVLCLPTTVQDLDTGEMVANAWRLAVAHPPGAPLYILFQHVFIHALPVGTVFWRAALATALCAVGALAALSKVMSDAAGNVTTRVVGCVALLIPLGLCAPLWAYAVRPDVFAPMALILAVACAVYFCGTATPGRAYGLTALLCAGVGVHQSMLFAAPLALHALWEVRSWKTLLGAACLAVGIIAASYAMLLGMHPDAMESWGFLQTPADVAHHMLRSEYGTFQLDGHGAKAAWGQNVTTLAQALMQSMPVSLGLVCACLVQRQGAHSNDARFRVVLGVLFFYSSVFFALANTSNSDILVRFFIFALVVTTALAARAWQQLILTARWRIGLAIGACVVTASNLPQNYAANNLAHDTVIEDYAQNLLRMATPQDGRPPVLITDGDTRNYALRYVQSVQEFHPDVLVLNVGGIFASQVWNKVQRVHPDFHFDTDWDQGLRARSIMAHVVAPNIAHYTFYFARDAVVAGYHTTFLGLGRRLTQGAGISAEPDSASRLTIRSVPTSEPSAVYDVRKDLYSEYAYVDLQAARLAQTAQASAAALQSALHKVPYCFVAQRALCNSRGADAQACLQRLDALRAVEHEYFR